MEQPNQVDSGGGTGQTRKLKTFGFVGPQQGSPSSLTLVTTDATGNLTAHGAITPSEQSGSMQASQNENSISVAGIAAYEGTVTIQNGQLNPPNATQLKSSAASAWGGSDGDTFNVTLNETVDGEGNKNYSFSYQQQNS